MAMKPATDGTNPDSVEVQKTISIFAYADDKDMSFRAWMDYLTDVDMYEREDRVYDEYYMLVSNDSGEEMLEISRSEYKEYSEKSVFEDSEEISVIHNEVMKNEYSNNSWKAKSDIRNKVLGLISHPDDFEDKNLHSPDKIDGDGNEIRFYTSMNEDDDVLRHRDSREGRDEEDIYTGMRRHSFKMRVKYTGGEEKSHVVDDLAKQIGGVLQEIDGIHYVRSHDCEETVTKEGECLI